MKKYALAVPYGVFWKCAIEDNGFEILPIDIRHTEVLIGMPYRDHRDPFDHLPAAQAVAEKAVIVSADPRFEQYGVQRIW